MPVCIAGMHRSGTSMVAHLLNLCGLYLGHRKELLEPAADNPAGYWENTQFSLLNEKILARLGGAWDMPPALEPGWETNERLAPLRAEAESLVDRFRAYPVWGWKDPRNSLTLPFWKSVIPDLKVVICLRHPLAVAGSLNARGYSSLLFGLKLWLTYNQPWLATQPGEHLVTHYNAYFDDPGRELRRVLNRLGLEASNETVRQACDSVAPPLRHQRGTTEDVRQADLPGPIMQLYQALCAQAEWTDENLPSREGANAEPLLSASAPAQTPTAQSLALERLLLEKDRALAYVNSQLEERRQAVAALNTQLQERQAERERAVAFLSSQLEERQRTITFLNSQREEHQQAIASLKTQAREQRQSIDGLQQELRVTRATAEAASANAKAVSAELESLRRTKFYRLAAVYWRWRAKLKTGV